MSLDRRLRGLEAALGPEDKLRALIADAHRFGSYLNYLRFMTLHPELSRPLEAIGSPLAWAATAPRTEKNKKKGAALLRAHDQALFLYFLHKEFNLLLLEEEQLLRLELVAAAEGALRLAGEQDAQAKSKSLDQEQALAAKLAHLTSRTRECLEAADILSRSYFWGADILFPELRERLQTLLAGAESARALLAEVLPRSAPKKDPRVRVEPRTRSLISRSTLAARAAALEALGQAERAARVNERLARFLVREMGSALSAGPTDATPDG